MPDNKKNNPNNNPNTEKKDLPKLRPVDKDFLDFRKKRNDRIVQNILQGKQTADAFGNYDSTGGFTAPTINWDNTNYYSAAKKGDWSKFGLERSPAYVAFEQQDFWDIADNAVKGFGALGAGGFLHNIGAWQVAAVPLDSDQVTASNWFLEWGDKLREHATKEHAIYQDPTGAMANWAYWGNHVQQAGYSVGLAAETYLEQLIAGAITGATGGATIGLNVGLGAMSGLKEAFINSRDTALQVRERALEKGLSIQEADALAKKAGMTNLKLEAGPVMFLNAVQNFTMFGKIGRGQTLRKAFGRGGVNLRMGVSDAVENIASKVFSGTKNKWKNRALRYGVILPGSEFVEEVAQTEIQKYSEYKTLKDAGFEAEYNPFDRESLDSGIGGAVGGFLMGAVGKGFSKGIGYYANKNFHKRMDKFLNESPTRSANTIREAYKAEQELAQAKKELEKDPKNEELKKKFSKALIDAKSKSDIQQISATREALYLDYLKDNGEFQNFDAHIKQMQDTYDAVNNNDTEKLKELGILDENGNEAFEGILGQIKDGHQDLIYYTESYKKKMIDTLDNVVNDFGVASKIVEADLNIESVESFKNTALNNIKNSENEEIKDLSDEESSYLNNRHEELILDHMINQLESKKKKTKQEREELESLKQKKKDIIDSFDSKEVWNNLPVESRKKLNGLSTEAIEEIQQNFYDYHTADSTLNNLKNVSKRLKSTKNIQRLLEEDQIEELNNITNEEDLNDFLESNKIENLSQKVKDLVDKKKASFKGKKSVKEEKPEETPPQRRTNTNLGSIIAEQLASGESLSPTAQESNLIGGNTSSSMTEANREKDEAMDRLTANLPEEDFDEEFDSRITPRYKSPDNVKELVDDELAYLSQRLGRPATFEDVVRYTIENLGFDTAEKIFDGLVQYYKDAGYTVKNVEEIYNKLFNPTPVINSVLNNTNRQLEQEEDNYSDVNDVEDDFGATFADEVGEHRNVMGQIEDSRTTLPFLKLAFNFLDSHRLADNRWRILNRDFREFKDNDMIQNHFILDPKFIKPGTKLRLQEYDVDSVTITANGESMSWGDYKRKNNLKPTDKAWANKVPIAVVYADGDNRTIVASVHDPEWYRDENISDLVDDKDEVIAQGKTYVAEIRKRVNESSDKYIDVKVKERKAGALDNTKEHLGINEFVSVKEATGETEFGVIKNGQLIINNKGNVSKKRLHHPLNIRNKQGKLAYPEGSVVELRYYDTINGEDVYFPLVTRKTSPISSESSLNQDLDHRIVNNLKFATMSSILLQNENSESFEELNKYFEENYKFGIAKARTFQSKILRETGIDLHNRLTDYYELFVQVERTSEGSFEDFLLEADRGMTYFDNRGRGQVTGKFKNEIKIAFNDGTRTSPIGLGSKTNKPKLTIKSFKAVFEGNNAIINKGSFAVSTKHLNKKTNISFTDESGNFNETISLQDLYKEQLKTNILSHEIETYSGEKKWILGVQPMIYFDTEDGLSNFDLKEEQAKNAEQRQQKITQSISEQSEESGNKGLSDEFIKDNLTNEQIEMLNGLDGVFGYEFDSRVNLSEEQKEDTKTIGGNLLEGVSPAQQEQVLTSLVHHVMVSLADKDSVKIKDVREIIESSVNEVILPALQNVENLLNILSKGENYQNDRRYLSLLNTRVALNNILSQQDKITSLRKGEEGLLTSFVGNIFQETISSEENIFDESSELSKEFEAEHNYSQTFLEKDIKQSFSRELISTFFGVPVFTEQGTSKTNSLLMPQYQNPEIIYNKLLEATTDIESNWEDLVSKLREKFKNSSDKTYEEIIKRLENSPEHVKNQILYKTISKQVDYFKVMTSLKYVRDNEIGKYVISGQDVTVLDENSSKERIFWRTNLDNWYKGSHYVVTNEEEVNIIDKEKLTNVSKALASYRRNKEMDTEKIKSLFDLLGLGLFSYNTIQSLTEEELYDKKRGIISLIHNKIRILAVSQETLYLDDPKNSIYDNSSKALDTIIKRQTDLNGTSISRSIKINGKIMQGVVADTMLFDLVQDLKKEDSEQVNNFLADEYTEGNFIINELKENPKFREDFGVSFMSPESMKQRKKNKNNTKNYNELSDTDMMSNQFGFYTYEKGMPKLVDENLVPGLTFRMGLMNSSALSDKKSVALFKTILWKSENNSILLNSESNEVDFSDSVLDFMLTQVFDSELKRIITAYKNPDKSNIVGRNLGGKIFHVLPIFNTIEYNGDNIHNILRNLANENTAVSGTFMISIRSSARELLRQYLENETNKKLSFDGLSGEFLENGIYRERKPSESSQISQIRFLDDTYMKNFEGTDIEKLRKLAAEYAVNFLLNKNNEYQLFINDLAYYSKDKFFKNVTEEILLDNGKTITTINGDTISKPENYVEIAHSVSQVVQKRAARLIAPGGKLANSSSNAKHSVFEGFSTSEFVHIAMKDSEVMSEMLDYMIRREYGENSSQYSEFKILLEIDERLKQYDIGKAEEEILKSRRKRIVSETLGQFEPYFNIEATDAQEYVTWRGYLDVLFRKGKLSTSETKKLKDVYNKLSAQEKDLSEKGEISKENYLTDEEYSVVMNPVKSVYTGSILHQDSIRPMYIKSSTVPLLPEATRNLKIDALRKKLEEVENKHSKFVRASYQTANKIGAVDTNLETKDFYEKNSNLDFLIEKSSTILPFKHYRIQQETDSKEEKAFQSEKDAVVSLGSQIFKMLMGNGINKINREVFDNIFDKKLLESLGIEVKDKYTGSELDDIYTKIYIKYSELQKERLYNELGLSKNRSFSQMTHKNKVRVMTNLVNMLRREVEVRNLPASLKDTLKMTETGDVSTLVPLLFDNNTYKFESLLHSIIVNRLIKQKLPGNQHILVSSEGFEAVKILEEVNENDKKGIVWVDENKLKNGGKLKATVVKGKDGKEYVSEAEVLIQPHFNTHVKVGEDENGNPIYEYKKINLASDEYSENIYNEEGKVVGKKLKEDKLHPSLLSMFTFRTPTSSHQSGAIVRIVGFLPKSMGDVVITSPEYLVQIGEDFDVDKRNFYKENYFIDSNGKISPIEFKTFEEKDFTIRTEKSIDEDVDRKNRELVENMLRAVFQQNINEIEVFYDEMASMGITLNQIRKSDFEKIRKRLKITADIKAFENTFIQAHKSVYTSTDREVQSKIYKPLITDVADKTVELIKNIDKTYDPFFSIASESHQRFLSKMAAAGKTAIGIHSNAVTFESLVQKLSEENKLQIFLGTKKDGETIPFFETLDGYASDGTLGKSTKTFDKARDIADHHGENQNVATDNINKLIMGYRNENDETISVFAVLAHLGWDMTRNELMYNGKNVGKQHIPSLFMSQPILRDYVKLKEQYRGIFADYFSDEELERKIISELIEKYDISESEPGFNSGKYFMDKSAYDAYSNDMSGQVLLDNLTNPESVDGNMQGAVLQKFLRLQDAAENIHRLQRIINISSKGLGLSYFQVIDTVNALNNIVLGNTDINIKNVAGVIGEYILQHEVDDNTDLTGYTLVGEAYWKPTTVEGQMLISSISAANAIMPIFFDYNSKGISYMINNIFEFSGKNINEISKKNTEFKYDILSNFNDFIRTNVRSFEGDVDEERRRLFYDSADNTSLGTWINTLREQDSNIMQNAFLKDLYIEVEDGMTRISHRPDYSVTFDKKFKYNAFTELLLNHDFLRDRKGKPIEISGKRLRVSELAQDLISYSNLAVTKVTGFREFVNINFQEKTGVNMDLRQILSDLQNGTNEEMLDNFIRQYFQHNPNEAKVIDRKDLVNPVKGLSKQHPYESFKLSENKRSKYVALRNTTKNGDKQWNLYELQASGFYVELDILGDNAINEYKHNSINKKSFIKENSTRDSKIFSAKGNFYFKNKNKQVASKIANIREIYTEGSIKQTLMIIRDSEKTPQDLKKAIEDILKYVPEDLQFYYDTKTQSGVDMGDNKLGTYSSSNNNIVINEKIFEILLDYTRNKENNQYDLDKAVKKLKQVFVEETVHYLTVNNFKKYVIGGTNENPIVADDAPAFVKELMALYELAKESYPFNPNDDISYHSSNIYEFMAGMFSSPEYRTEVNNRNEDFIDRFKALLHKLFRFIFREETGEVLSYDSLVFKNIKDLIEDSFDIKTINVKQTEDVVLSEEINDLYTQIHQDFDTDYLANNRTTTFEQVRELDSPYSERGVVITFLPQAQFHFGNPFNSREYKVENDYSEEVASKRYLQWVLTSSDERATWIREELRSGNLKDKKILYYNFRDVNGYHRVLNYLINQFDWENNTFKVNEVSEVTEEKAERKIENTEENILQAQSLLEKIGLDEIFSLTDDNLIPLSVEDVYKMYEQALEGTLSIDDYIPDEYDSRINLNTSYSQNNEYTENGTSLSELGINNNQWEALTQEEKNLIKKCN